MAKGDKEIKDAREQNIEAIKWFHTSFHKSTEKIPSSFRKTIVRYLWDEWLTVEEQKELVGSGLEVEECIRNNRYELGKMIVERFMNPTTEQIEYYCQGEKCKDSIIRGVIEDQQKSDVIRFDKQTIGPLYGFLTPKNGKFVFKTDEPKENTILRGQECANSTNMRPKLDKLKMLGTILKEANKSDFDLNDVALHGTRPIRAASRACTLIDLLLRFVHIEGIQDKKWFFRPVQTTILTEQLKKAKPKKK